MVSQGTINKTKLVHPDLSAIKGCLFVLENHCLLPHFAKDRLLFWLKLGSWISIRMQNSLSQQPMQKFKDSNQYYESRLDITLFVSILV